MRRIAVIGAGAWGQALALHAARAGHRVRLLARTPDHVVGPDGHSRRLPFAAWPREIAIGGPAPVREADLALVAVPVAHLRATLAATAGDGGYPLVLCCKGMEGGTLALPAEIAADAAPGHPVALWSGPNFAHEVARGLPAAAVLAAADAALATDLASALAERRIRLYPSDDIVGVGVCGATKNVIAIAAGVAIGASLGENARAALVVRGLAETGRLAEALGGRPETVGGLAGAGDLLLTATGTSSRNFRVGHAIGRGEAAAAIGADEVAEGVATADPLLARGMRAGVDLPITAAVADLVGRRITVSDAMERLLSRASARA